MNILFVITKSEVGGAQKFVKEQIDITKNDFKVFLCTNKDGWLTNETKLQLNGILLHEGIEKMTSIGFLIKLYIFIKANKINLVVTNSANGGFYGRLAAFIADSSACYYSHGWSSVYNGGKFAFVLNFIEKILSIISKKVICVSDNDYKIAKNKIGISPFKLCVLKNAIYPVINNSFSSKSIENKCFTVIALTRFASPKRIDLMIAAFKQLPNLKLHIAGTGPDFMYWQQYLLNNNISNVTLLGEVASFNKFDNYEAFLLISDSEGLPISAIEAMSAGLPLILSNVGGCPELILNNGILVDNNCNAIVNAVLEVQQKQHDMRIQSNLLFNKYYNLNMVSKIYINTYLSLINKHSIN